MRWYAVTLLHIQELYFSLYYMSALNRSRQLSTLENKFEEVPEADQNPIVEQVLKDICGLLEYIEPEARNTLSFFNKNEEKSTGRKKETNLFPREWVSEDKQQLKNSIANQRKLIESIKHQIQLIEAEELYSDDKASFKEIELKETINLYWENQAKLYQLKVNLKSISQENDQICRQIGEMQTREKEIDEELHNFALNYSTNTIQHRILRDKYNLFKEQKTKIKSSISKMERLNETKYDEKLKSVKNIEKRAEQAQNEAISCDWRIMQQNQLIEELLRQRSKTESLLLERQRIQGKVWLENAEREINRAHTINVRKLQKLGGQTSVRNDSRSLLPPIKSVHRSTKNQADEILSSEQQSSLGETAPLFKPVSIQQHYIVEKKPRKRLPQYNQSQIEFFKPLKLKTEEKKPKASIKLVQVYDKSIFESPSKKSRRIKSLSTLS